jgi:hypothetical protein
VVEKSFGHLAAAGIVDADKEHTHEITTGLQDKTELINGRRVFHFGRLIISIELYLF